MRTPGSDIELTQGFLFTENIIRDRADIASVRYCNSVGADGRNTYNVLDVELARGVSLPDTGIERNFYTTSSCGVCGRPRLTRSGSAAATDPPMTRSESGPTR
jgi:FdhD protein